MTTKHSHSRGISSLSRTKCHYDPERQSLISTTCSKRFCAGRSLPAGEARSIEPVSAKPSSVLYLDTLAMCKYLEQEGFSSQQAETLTKALCNVVNVGLEYQTKMMVTKPQQEIMVQQLMSLIGNVKKDMVILEKSEFVMIRNDTEKQSLHIKQLESQLADEIKKLSGLVKLDINLEKSRATEAHAYNEKNLQELRNRIDITHAIVEKDVQKISNRIDVEISATRTQYEKKISDIYRYSTGLILSATAIVMGFLRLMS